MDTLSRIRPFRLICALVILLGVGACNSRPSVTRQPSVGTATTVPTENQPTQTALIIPALSPEPRIHCPGAPPSRLILQERGFVLPDDPRPVNLRIDSGTAYAILERIPPRTIFYVLDGPVCIDGYAWFRIKAGNVEGWIAEGDQNSYYVDAYLPG